MNEHDLEQQVIAALKTVYDPELPVNVYDLGLIYEVRIEEDNKVFILMTLTTVGCPAADFLPGQVEASVRELEDVEDVKVRLTFDPPYHRDMMSEEAKMELGFYF